jgi:hypothetical protein
VLVAVLAHIILISEIYFVPTVVANVLWTLLHRLGKFPPELGSLGPIRGLISA